MSEIKKLQLRGNRDQKGFKATGKGGPGRGGDSLEGEKSGVRKEAVSQLPEDYAVGGATNSVVASVGGKLETCFSGSTTGGSV